MRRDRETARRFLYLAGVGIACVACGEAAPAPPRVPRERVAQMHVYSERPTRPIAPIQTVEVRCPTEMESVNFTAWTSTSEMVGGCSYQQAVWKASEKAALLNADGIFDLHATAAANGRVVLLIATAFRYAGPASPPAISAPPAAASIATPAPLATAQPVRPPVEERLKRLRELRDQGLITPEDFERRKTEILSEI